MCLLKPLVEPDESLPATRQKQYSKPYQRYLITMKYMVPSHQKQRK